MKLAHLNRLADALNNWEEVIINNYPEDEQEVALRECDEAWDEIMKQWGHLLPPIDFDALEKAGFVRPVSPELHEELLP